jgi:hypothetical protein
LREEGRLTVFENTVMRIFGPKRNEVTREWRKLHSEELNDCVGDKIEKNEMGETCSAYGRKESCIQGCGGET